LEPLAPERVGCIYLLRNLKNSKGYVGKSLDVETRWVGHIKDARGGSVLPLHRAIRKYGAENFSAEILHTCAESLLNAAEKYFIILHSTHIHSKPSAGYNVTLGGDGGPMPPSVCKRISVKVRALWANAAYRAKTSTAILAGGQTSAARAAKSIAAKKRNLNPVWQARRTATLIKTLALPGARERMSIASKTALAKPDTKAKLHVAAKARMADPSVRAKVSASVKMWWTPERRAAQAERARLQPMLHGSPRLGKRHTAETKARISASKCAYFENLGAACA
jgi:group I intron endonuclease